VDIACAQSVGAETTWLFESFEAKNPSTSASQDVLSAPSGQDSASLRLTGVDRWAGLDPGAALPDSWDVVSAGEPLPPVFDFDLPASAASAFAAPSEWREPFPSACPPSPPEFNGVAAAVPSVVVFWSPDPHPPNASAIPSAPIRRTHAATHRDPIIRQM